MKTSRKWIAVLLALVIAFSGLAIGAPTAEAAGAQQKDASALFRAQFEGDKVAGTGEAVDGVYRIAATKTDGEAWHVKLESNYPTVTGHEYRVTYRFHSDRAGTVKFGDFQEFKIEKGDNEITGMLIAKGSTSYLDLQLGALGPFTIDFSQIEIVEKADNVKYENALPAPLQYDDFDMVSESHDQGYSPDFQFSSDAITVSYSNYAVWEPGVWKARLRFNTGFVPQAGNRYRISADVLCEEDLDFEVLLNRGEKEKGYGALYGRHAAAGELTTIEHVLTLPASGFLGEELVLQFSLGLAPDEVPVTVSNIRVEKILDEYKNVLPAAFALDKVIASGKVNTTAIPRNHTAVDLADFSYSSTDTVYEGHDDGYVVNLTESAKGATYAITKAPANPADRGVWKAKLYADTGVDLEAGKTYRIKFDLYSAFNQAEYEVCLDGNKEDDYGKYIRSLTKGVTENLEFVITPDAARGPLTLRLQLGKTDSANGNTVTMSNLSVEKLNVTYDPPVAVSLTAGSDGNVKKDDGDGLESTLSVTASSAALTITKAHDDGAGGIWSGKMIIETGFTPEPGHKYRVSANVQAEGDPGTYEFLLRNSAAEDPYGGFWGQTGSGVLTRDFTAPASDCGELVLLFQLGNSAAGTTVTVSDLLVCEITGGSMEDVPLPDDFAYPTVTPESTEFNDFDLYVNPAAAAALTGNGESAKVTVTTPSEGWHVKLYAKPGLALEAGETYTISLDVANADDCKVNFKNTSAEGEDGFGSATVSSGSVTHSVTPTASGTMEIVLEIGNVAAGTEVTVTNIAIKQTTTDFLPMDLGGFAYPVVTEHPATNGSFELDHGTLSSDGAKAVATVSQTYGADYENKFYVKPGLTLSAGKIYRVSGSVGNYSGTVFFKNATTGNEEGFGTAAVSGGAFSADIEPTQSGELQIFLKVGLASPETPVSLWNIKIEEYSRLSLSGTTYFLEFNKMGDDGTPGTGEWSESSNSFTITSTPNPQDNWVTKFFVRPGKTLVSGHRYRISFTINTTHDGFDVCFLNPDPWNEEAHGGSRWVTTNTRFTHEIDGEDDVMQIVLKAGWVGPGVSVSFDGLTITDLSSLTDVTPSLTYPSPAYETVTGNSFSLTASNGAAAALGSTGSNATVTVSTPGAAGDIVLTADTGAAMSAETQYKIDMNVANAEGCTVALVNGSGAELGTGTVSGGKFTQTITPAEAGNLKIRLLLGTVAADTVVTVSGVQVSEFGTGENDVTPEFKYPVTTPASVEGNSFKVDAEHGAAASLGGDGSATATAMVTTPGDDWHIKFYAMPDLALEDGGTYEVSLRVNNASGCDVCFKDLSATGDGAETAYGVHRLSSDDETFTQTITGSGGTLEILVKIGDVPTGTVVSISEISIRKLGGETQGENQMPTLVGATEGTVKPGATETGYAFALSADSSSADVDISAVPAEGREAWKLKVFAHTGLTLTAGTLYRVTAELASDAEMDYEIAYNNGGAEAALGSQGKNDGLHITSAGHTAVFEVTPDTDADLVLQFNLGWAPSPCHVTIRSVKVEKATVGAAENLTPSFRCDSVGYISRAADNGYVTSLEKDDSSATLSILKAPAERNPWNVKLNVRTGFTPERGQGYVVSFDIEAEQSQKVFEVFYDGDSEAAYGQIYGPSLRAGKRTVSYTIYPGSSKGELTLQLRFGKTNGTDGNRYTVSNVKIEKVTFDYYDTPVMAETASLWAHADYNAKLTKTPKQAMVSFGKLPAEGREPWKTKLFITTGVKVQPGQKYRVCMDVFANIDTPFEICLNKDDVEKGVGALYGLTALPEMQTVEFIFYAEEEANLVIQLSLGRAYSHSTFTVSNVKVERAGGVSEVSDTIYTF